MPRARVWVVVVLVDRGFNEGTSGHRYAPYVFLATNDTSVIRDGDREDIAPTVLKRFGVDLSQLNPPMDGTPLDEPAPRRIAPAQKSQPGLNAARSTRRSRQDPNALNTQKAPKGRRAKKAAVCLHGGGPSGSHWAFAPESLHYANDDQDPLTPGRQPSLGNGDPDDGTPWGTWSGYYDWDTTTITDTPLAWACTMFLIGQSSCSVDNYPGTTATCDVSVRRPQRFHPPDGAVLNWRLVRMADGTILQAGTTSPESDGLVVVTGLSLFKDPIRCRLEVRFQPQSGDLDPGGDVDEADGNHGFAPTPVYGSL